MKQSIVIYDGDCGICEKCRTLIERLDWFSRLQCLPLQEMALYSRFPLLKYEDCQRELKLIEEASPIIGGADAVIKICLKLPLMIPVGALFSLPLFKQVARWLYPIVASNRYRISSTCGLENRQKPKP
jgi:predicted DCC family thiol-disulfide oxidoreductase YuxK